MATILPSIIIALHLSVGWGGFVHRCVPQGRVASVYVNSRRVPVTRGVGLIFQDNVLVTSVGVHRGCVRVTSLEPARITVNYS